jgi:hypothetical protein
MKRFLASFGCALLFSAFALGQISSSASTGPNGMHGTMHFQAPSFYGVVITGAPYSAEKVHEHVQTLADGTHITQTFPETKAYRDSMGRTREERPVLRGAIERHANAPKSPILVEINDPVAHVRYIFTLDEPVAHRQELPADNPRRTSTQVQTGQAVGNGAPGMVAVTRGCGETETPPIPTLRAVTPSTGTRRRVDDPTRPQTTTEDLGTQIIEGIQVEGRRQTTIWPVGSVGNDRPITATTETWRSPDLKEDVLRKSDDPRYGEQTNKLVNVSRSEPDASLFEPPPGYTVKDETGEFTIEWSATR